MTSKYTIEDCVAYAKKNYGECLSKKYSPKRKILWKCRCGNEWKGKFPRMKLNESWCVCCRKFMLSNGVCDFNTGITNYDPCINCGEVISNNHCIKCHYPKGNTEFNDYFSRHINMCIYRHKCYDKKKGYQTDITKEHIEDKLIKHNFRCYYCANPISLYNYKNPYGYGKIYGAATIDRLYSKKGHTIENTVICCHLCNSDKNNLDPIVYIMRKNGYLSNEELFYIRQGMYPELMKLGHKNHNEFLEFTQDRQKFIQEQQIDHCKLVNLCKKNGKNICYVSIEEIKNLINFS